jgi:hypothetical protein
VESWSLQGKETGHGGPNYPIILSALEESGTNRMLADMTPFAAALETADRLPLDEQEELADTLRRRVAERRREELIAAVKEARAEFARGKIKPRSSAAIMKSIVG